MAGCFGDSKEDRHFEKQLDDYLEGQNETCSYCKDSVPCGELSDEGDDKFSCESCQRNYCDFHEGIDPKHTVIDLGYTDAFSKRYICEECKEEIDSGGPTAEPPGVYGSIKPEDL
jgi:hypothetical protein